MQEALRPQRRLMPSTYSRLIARELGLTVKEIPSLLKGANLGVDEFLQEDHSISATQQIQILGNAMQLSPHPDFGLRLGRRLTPSTHGAMGFVANSSPDLLTAMNAVQAYLPTRINFATFQLEMDDEWLDCSFSYDVDMDACIQRCLSETLIKASLEIAEFILGFAPADAETCFPHTAPPYQPLYSQHLPGKITFDADQLVLKLPMKLCQVPNAAANHQNYQLAVQRCESMLEELPDQIQSYELRIKRMMLSHPPGRLNEEEAAAALFMNKRTLARKLAREQTGFRKIRDEILSQQATEFLCHDRLSVEAVAMLLNYHDSPTFRRAFKRWFGIPPEKFRGSKLN